MTKKMTSDKSHDEPSAQAGSQPSNLLGEAGKTGGSVKDEKQAVNTCLLYTSPSPRDGLLSRMPSSA